jgi:hypothetical protein
MTVDAIENSFRERVCGSIRIAKEGTERYRVFTPFLFDDGDHFAIALRRRGETWDLSDEGHTYMHLTYDLDERDLQRGSRQKIITNTLSYFYVEDRDGELTTPVRDDAFGDALFSFVQALAKISDISFLSRERVRSTFMEDFEELFATTVPEDRREFNWAHPEQDPRGIYAVDCRINRMTKPLFVFALSGDDRTRDATIALHQFEKWNVPHRSIGIFEDQETVNRKVLARFSDVCEKQFSALGANRDRIRRYVEESMS